VDHFETLALSTENFESLLSQVSNSDLTLPTPCEGWSVSELVWHVARASDMTVLLLNDATRDDAVKLFDVTAPPNVLEECQRAIDEELTSFANASDLEVMTHHPMGDVTVAQLFDFRILDLTIHFWDLARAVGADEIIPDALVTYVYATVLPMEEIIGQVGIFGEGPSHSIGSDAPSQVKLLDLLGRRP
jgi:uncharacterized protein (TIGR03086 family)